MKNYEETIESVFARIEKHNRQQKKNKQIIITTLCSICLIACAFFGIRQAQQSEPPTISYVDPLYTTPSDLTEETIESVMENKISIQQIETYDASLMDIALMTHDFVAMRQEDINHYYGMNVFPDVPDDLSPWKNQHWGIYRRDHGTGEIYYDQNILNYSNEDVTRGFCLTVAKGKLPFFCFIIEMSAEELSVINGQTVAIMQSADGQYHAEFLYKNTGFYISTLGISQAELVSIIESLIC